MIEIDNYYNKIKLLEQQINNTDILHLEHNHNLKPDISVVMSVYKYTKFLELSIKSIILQTFDNFEFIIVVEYSEDMIKICEFLNRLKDKRIIFIKNKRKLGFSDSLNIGFKMAKGKYIVRMDDDDISTVDRLEKQFDFMEKNIYIDICGSYCHSFMNEFQLMTQPLNQEELKVKCLFETPFFHPSVIIKKDSFEKNNLFYDKGYFTEDYDLWSRAIENCSFANIPEVLLFYRIYGENNSIINQEKVNASHLSIMKRNLNYYLDLKFEDAEISIIRKIINGWKMNTQEENKAAKIVKKIEKNNESFILSKKMIAYYLHRNDVDKVKKKNAIIIADTRVALIGHMLLQLKETNENTFDIAIVYYETMSDSDKAILESIMPCEFIKYSYEFPENIMMMSSFKKFTKLMFCRYDMFDLLEMYKTVTWIDTDVLINTDLTPLLKTAEPTGFIANFEDLENYSYKYPDTIKSSFKELITGYDYEKYNMSSGFIILCDSLKNRQQFTNWCYKKTVEYAKYLDLPDQAILNLLIQEFNIDVKSLGERGTYCVYPYNGRNTQNAKIIHAWGARKFWNNFYLFNKYPKWNQIYKKWLKLGGSELKEYYPEPKVSVVIPTFKPSTLYLSECLESVLYKQKDIHGFDYDDIEVIIVAEPFEIENIKNIVNKYDDLRIKLYVNEDRFGIAKSLNKGIQLSNGKYIARMDDDDISQPTRLYLQSNYLDIHEDVHLVTSDYEYFGHFNEKRNSLEGEIDKAWSIFTCPFDHPSIMLKKNFFVNNQLLYDESRKYVEDWELWLRAFDAGMKVGTIHQILFSHRWHNLNASQNNNSVNMMFELIEKNFQRLGVSISSEDLKFIGPWNGKCSKNEYKKLKSYFRKAIKNNKQLHLYNCEALKYVFSLRLNEALNGSLNALIKSPISGENKQNMRIIKKILYPLYRPFRYQVEKIMVPKIDELNNKIIELQVDVERLKNGKDD